MKNGWVSYLKGYVKMRIDGPYGERFLNRCIQKNIDLWNIKRLGNERIVCYISLEDAKRVKEIVKQTECKVTFMERRGLPFLQKSMIKRGGFTAGVAGFLFLLFVLSNVVWNISIEGASPKVEHQLQQVVADLGIKRGKFMFVLPSVEEIQKEVSDRIEDATWVGVRLNGTTFHFEVVEQTLPEEKELISPRHLVATKKAIVHDLFVEKGQALVKPNEFVNEGDILVSGFIGKEGKTEIVPAQAEVYGEIWYKSDVSIPLEATYDTLTGNYEKKHYLSFFGTDIPFWGFFGEKYNEYEIFERNYSFRLLNWTLPVQYKSKRWLEKQTTEMTYTEEEAKELAKKRAKEELKDKIQEDATIKGEKVLHESVENGKVKLTIHYQVIEEITSAQPIIQGD
ncbi:sporulation protein YqfD [Alkalihalobacillus sp. LMS39]|uniref:sporulation protein YqfD n=1 Tax=Alkalihalobacillus sp. LMS39 TaxID=2924032 RepID=UPI001FB33B5B|nr:sporulation protein YqfD [Alkalihalobacillus sp. LMS39]UOE95671.1 sporulation protein YqfD [Alkalihalobacillus sp. LMS39]